MEEVIYSGLAFEMFHIFCDKFYVKADIFEGQFYATPKTIKNKGI